VMTGSDDRKMLDPNAAVPLSLHEVQGTQNLTHSDEPSEDTQWVFSLYPWVATQVPR
jgi:hypothetical protein